MKISERAWGFILAGVILYTFQYFVFVNSAAQEDYLKESAAYIVSLLFAIVGIPVGYYLSKKHIVKKKKEKNVKWFGVLLAIMWVFLAGLFSVFGLVIGMIIAEDSRSTNKR